MALEPARDEYVIWASVGDAADWAGVTGANGDFTTLRGSIYRVTGIADDTPLRLVGILAQPDWDAALTAWRINVAGGVGPHADRAPTLLERGAADLFFCACRIPAGVIKSNAETDNIEGTLNYKAVAKRVQQFVGDSEYQLVETLAEKIAETILTEFDIAWIQLRVSKPGAIRNAKNVGVVIRRHKA